ncbi:hypothetical protein BpHYR1_040161 [Brachionus plicatilis]|uniref:Uncharacterized protein n=1 Tax=Brachionus plicatilis TaxID=10195 RepID=A0A3M7SK88_BRAPC|nr:hypothetical protein BpHYR1_040161 [Brachionus plicatilis]
MKLNQKLIVGKHVESDFFKFQMIFSNLTYTEFKKKGLIKIILDSEIFLQTRNFEQNHYGLYCFIKFALK